MEQGLDGGTKTEAKRLRWIAVVVRCFDRSGIGDRTYGPGCLVDNCTRPSAVR